MKRTALDLILRTDITSTPMDSLQWHGSLAFSPDRIGNPGTHVPHTGCEWLQMTISARLRLIREAWWMSAQGAWGSACCSQL